MISRPAWVIAAAVAMFGALWLTPLAMDASSLGFLALLLAGAVAAGGMIARHSGRGLVEPVLGALFAAIALMLASRLQDPLVLDGPLVAHPSVFWFVPIVAVVGALLGALAGHRFSARTPTFATITSLAGILGVGTVLAMMQLLRAIDYRLVDDFVIPVLLLGTVASGFITQALIGQRRAWACGSGCMILCMLLIADSSMGPGPIGVIAGAFLGTIPFWLLGALGAAIAGRVFRARFVEQPQLPTATLT